MTSSARRSAPKHRATHPAGHTDADQQRAASEALAAWPIAVAEATRISVSENIAFRVRDSRGRLYVLRLHRPWYHNHAELLSEQVWTAALLEAGLDVPVVVKAGDGRGYVPVRVGDERRYAGLLEWVEGETLAARIAAGKETDVPAAFARLGRTMAALHDQAARWPVPSGFVRHAFDADGLMGEQPFWGRFWESPHLSAGQSRRLEALRHRVHARLRTLAKSTDAYTLIHADLHPANVVVDGSRLHVIDFDDAGFGWHAYDLAVALYHYEETAAYEAVRQALISGYRRLRPLADETVAMIPLFLLIRSLASIGWTAARPELPGGAERTAWLIERIDRTADATGNL